MSNNNLGTHLYESISSLTKDHNTAKFYIISTLYLTIGIISFLCLTFKNIINIMYLSHKKGIYSMYRVTCLLELGLSIHLLKSGLTNLYEEINVLFCKLDSSISFFLIISTSYMYTIQMIFFFISKGKLIRIKSIYKVLIIGVFLITGLFFIFICFVNKLFMYTNWYTCFIIFSDDNIYLYFIYLFPVFTYIVLSFAFAGFVVKGDVKLIGNYCYFHYFSCVNSIAYMLFSINLFYNIQYLASISLLIININNVLGRLYTEVVSFAYLNNKNTDNKFVFFILILLGITSPPVDSTLIEVYEHQKIVLLKLEQGQGHVVK